MKVIFMGTPDFAQESLQALYKAKHTILSVITNPDKPKGRGMKLTQSPVKQFALEKQLTIYQPQQIKGNTEFIQELKHQKPDVICVVAYGKLLPKEILDIPKYGCINVHASLLPKYRGAAPIQWAVLNGDKTTGVTTIYMNEGMDTGDIILKKQVSIGETETTGELWNRLSILGANLLIDTLEQIENGTAPREKQGTNFSVAPMLKKEMAKINWEEQTTTQIYNLVRGLNPIMGAYALFNGKKIKFWKVDIDNTIVFKDNIVNGTVINSNPKDGIMIKTKNGILKVIEIQPEKGKRMSIQDFLRGNNIDVGEIFE